jgi:hypothetical protein
MKKTLLFACILMLYTFLISTSVLYDFTDEHQNETLILKAYTGRHAPMLGDGYLQLMQGGYAKHHHNAVIFPDIIPSTPEIEYHSFGMFITPGAHGASLLLINTELVISDSLAIVPTSWEAPNVPKSFGIGLDIYNPQTSAWFDEHGNFYGREQREISLHWDNVEQFKVMSPIEFRANPMEFSSKRFDLTIQYVLAGALISFAIEGTTIIEDFFIPDMYQYEKRPVIGASTGELTTTVVLTEYCFTTTGVAPQTTLLTSMMLLNDEVFHAGRRDMKSTVSFPKPTSRADRVIMTIDLSGATGGVSAWDVGAAIYIYGDDGQRYEIVRYITPYNRGYIWRVDVSDFLPLFMGKKEIYARVDTWETVTENPDDQRGWKVSARLDFYRGKVERKSFMVQNLWNGNFEDGNPEKPLVENLSDTVLSVPRGAKSAKLRMVVTGHGMHPNTDNAAEFRPALLTVVINGIRHEHLLWKTDCYLNPVRPQDGTWKFDRAGWAPGDVVSAWEIDLTHLLPEGTIHFSYIADDYINIGRGDHYPPHLTFASQVIYYR